MDQEYITVAEFAEKTNISKQRVYQLLKKKLKPYLNIIDNKKMINISALNEITIQGGCSTPCSRPLKGVESAEKLNIKPFNDADNQEESLNIQGGCSTPCSTPLNELELLKSTIDMLQSTVDMLKNQLDVKDNTIHELTEALKAEQQQTSQAQLLHCGSIKQSLLADQLEKQDNDVNTEKADSPKHVALFDRIFKRK